jgi:hypothetical protein
MSLQYRQGDIWIESAKFSPKGQTKRIETGIVAYGELTGHSHKIVSPHVELLVDEAGKIWARSSVPFKMEHDEHGPIDFPAGEYCISRQREYDPLSAEKERQVAD